MNFSTIFSTRNFILCFSDINCDKPMLITQKYSLAKGPNKDLIG